jgi:hypothetical protein
VLKAIVASGYSNDPVMAYPATYGFDGIVVKPFNMEKVSRALEMILTTGPKVAVDYSG